MARLKAFTLLELMTVIVIIAILGTILLGTTEKVRARVERVRCVNNLRGLHVAASSYLQQNGKWPQINPFLLKKKDGVYEERWVKALEPFGVQPKNWLCPTVTRVLGEPDWKKTKSYRIDYTPMPFDDKPFTPHRWTKQPWFIEKGDVHGSGNLIIFPDGSITTLNELAGKR